MSIEFRAFVPIVHKWASLSVLLAVEVNVVTVVDAGLDGVVKMKADKGKKIKASSTPNLVFIIKSLNVGKSSTCNSTNVSILPLLFVFLY